MALVSAAALITEQLAFVEILQTINSIFEPRPVSLKCFVRIVHFLTLLFQQKHCAGQCHHQQQTALFLRLFKIYSNQS